MQQQPLTRCCSTCGRSNLRDTDTRLRPQPLAPLRQTSAPLKAEMQPTEFYMCGLFGAVTTKGFFDPKDVNRYVGLTNLVSYRGPSDCGTVTLSTGGRADGCDVFLGHRRLSILDLSPLGHQPMHDGSGHWIIFNGEIFNFQELRIALEAEGHSFRSGTDTEVILRMYQVYGPEAFAQLNGMWALAIVDLPRRRLVLSRDRFSLKPLYMLTREGTLFFASEIKQLLPLLPTKELNRSVMSSFLTQGLVEHSRETFFKGITKVPAKTSIVVDLTSLVAHEHHYWDYSYSAPLKPAETVEHFRDLLIDSVRLRLRSDVKLGVLLSGGLDSSVIALLANQLTMGTTEMYSIVSSDHRYSEERFIDAMTSARQLRTRKISFSSSDALDTLNNALFHNDEPFVGMSVLAQYKLFKDVRANTNATVLLSGQGGDELLLGYLKYFFFYLRDLIKKRQYSSALVQLLSSILLKTVIRQFSVGQARRYLKPMNKFRTILRRDYQFVNRMDESDMMRRQMDDLDLYSVPALARYEDRNSMAHSLETRHPFLDHRLVNFAINVRTEQNIYRGWTKYVLRKGFPELPDCVRWRRDKKGFTTPEEQWIRNEFGGSIVSCFRDSKLNQMDVIYDKRFLAYYRRFLGSRMIASNDISRVFIAEMWARQHF